MAANRPTHCVCGCGTPLSQSSTKPRQWAPNHANIWRSIRLYEAKLEDLHRRLRGP